MLNGRRARSIQHRLACSKPHRSCLSLRRPAAETTRRGAPGTHHAHRPRHGTRLLGRSNDRTTTQVRRVTGWPAAADIDVLQLATASTRHCGPDGRADWLTGRAPASRRIDDPSTQPASEGPPVRACSSGRPPRLSFVVVGPSLPLTRRRGRCPRHGR